MSLSMSFGSVLAAVGLGLLLALSPSAPVQARAVDGGSWTLDPGRLLSQGRVVVERAPDAELERLYQAVVAAARTPAELKAMCALFDPGARRDPAALDQVARHFGADSRRRFRLVSEVLSALTPDAPRQWFDPELARRALHRAAVVAGMLFDGFIAGIQARGGDPASRQARCRALHQLLEAIGLRPPAERAMIMRLLLRDGLAGRVRLPQ